MITLRIITPKLCSHGVVLFYLDIFVIALTSPLASATPFISQYLERFLLSNRFEDHTWVKKQRWRISDASFPFPSSYNRNYKRSKASRSVIRGSYSTARHIQHEIYGRHVATEPKRGFDKYPQVELLILAERVLVKADPLQQGHGVKTQQ